MKYFHLLLTSITTLSFLQIPAQTNNKIVWKPNKKVTTYATIKSDNSHLVQSQASAFQPMAQPLETNVCIFIDPTHQFQSITGFGGAITDASAETYAQLPQQVQEEIIKAYYDSISGLGYNIVRTNMNSCDFSSDSYTYVKDNDYTLSSFNIDHDKKYRLPLLQKARKAIGKDFTFFISPWSPPAWMKDNNSMLHGGHLKTEYYNNWANYFIKYIHALEQNGLPVWGLTVQNEPMANQTWESCIFSAEQERDFLKKSLGPTLWKNGMKDKKVIIWDHNRDLIFQYASTILNDPDATKYVWGTGIHWYETWTKSAPLFQNEKLLKDAFPQTNLFFTEGCKEQFDFAKINDWSLGELYGNQILNDLNAGITGWTDWNILLDTKGGPNHVGNFCFAPIHADINTGKLYYTMEYWYIAQFSKFIRPGARRVAASSNRDKLQTTAFLNRNGTLVVVVLNTSDEQLDYSLWIKGKASNAVSQPHSVVTWVL
ncbi:MAG: glycosyl hydrolase [Pseudopedobacter saltans]|uniref:Glycosyl hydrolase n=1 Tax=Pseudopedobacter saltans TaxID=151895 RepID=A0A2W5HF92_9SPHI|nr:MAG: glycosyl hydrolase [Pseudopedobacter saltans]